MAKPGEFYVSKTSPPFARGSRPLWALVIGTYTEFTITSTTGTERLFDILVLIDGPKLVVWADEYLNANYRKV